MAKDLEIRFLEIQTIGADVTPRCYSSRSFCYFLLVQVIQKLLIARLATSVSKSYLFRKNSISQSVRGNVRFLAFQSLGADVVISQDLLPFFTCTSNLEATTTYYQLIDLEKKSSVTQSEGFRDNVRFFGFQTVGADVVITQDLLPFFYLYK